MCFEESPWPLQETWRRICHEHDEVIRFIDRQDVEEGDMMCKRWKKPPPGSINLVVDGSFRPVERCMGYGGIVRDDQGHWVFGFHGFQEGGNVLMSEALALKTGLQLVWEKGYRNVVCNVDCRELLNSVNDAESHRFLPILEDIHAILLRPWTVVLANIDMEYNQPADWLAKTGASSHQSHWCMLHDPSSELEIIIMSDCFAAF
ncbi:uncharacterized protein LOC130746545 [Lotus japonicus]|uniref:uncharacterized protein LOC130746545 n=1 Tax=Lotus japonicus TaxID=34305 RepID=UPI00258EEBBA|nr:uncharacterized protein LOC130746545 [Lotus japonicus]